MTEPRFEPPHILLLADAGAGANAALHAIDALGARASGPIELDRAEEQLERIAQFDAIMLELDDGNSALAGSILTLLRQLSVSHEVRVVACCRLDAIDRVEGQLAGTPAVLLVDADEAERIAALTLVLEEGAALRNRVREIDPVRLRRIADEVGRIARALANLSAQSPAAFQNYPRDAGASVADGKTGFSAEPPDLAAAPLPTADAVRKIIRMRRLRDSYFAPALFADPAWDMLLDLLAAHIEGDRVAVSSLCIAAAVPPTTALRWIKTMTEDGLIERHADPEDGRRVYVGLTPAARVALAGYFQAVGRFEGVAI